MTPEDIERLPQKEETTDESKLIEVAPIAKPSKIEKIDKPEVVYKPTESTTTTTISSTTTLATVITENLTTELETTTSTEDPIASHVNFLLQQYFSTQTPDSESQGIPMLTYDDENHSIVMEYVSPDGEEDKIEEPVQKAADTQVPSFFPIPENPEGLVLPEANMATLDRIFEPSKKTNEADWHVLDENNVRVNFEKQKENEEEVALEENHDSEMEEVGIETDIESSTDRFTVGDFEPIISPDYYVA